MVAGNPETLSHFEGVLHGVCTVILQQDIERAYSHADGLTIYQLLTLLILVALQNLCPTLSRFSLSFSSCIPHPLPLHLVLPQLLPPYLPGTVPSSRSSLRLRRGHKRAAFPGSYASSAPPWRGTRRRSPKRVKWAQYLRLRSNG